jgi:hypothetical protein
MHKYGSLVFSFFLKKKKISSGVYAFILRLPQLMPGVLVIGIDAPISTSKVTNVRLSVSYLKSLNLEHF